MNLKTRNYYINKIKEFFGIALSAIMLDGIIIGMLIYELLR